MARVNEGSHSFTLPPTRLSRTGISHTCLYSPAAKSITALWLVLISRPAEGRRLSWPGWLGEVVRWFVRRRRSLICLTMLPLRHAACIQLLRYCRNSTFITSNLASCRIYHRVSKITEQFPISSCLVGVSDDC